MINYVVANSDLIRALGLMSRGELKGLSNILSLPIDADEVTVFGTLLQNDLEQVSVHVAPTPYRGGAALWQMTREVRGAEAGPGWRGRAGVGAERGLGQRGVAWVGGRGKGSEGKARDLRGRERQTRKKKGKGEGKGRLEGEGDGKGKARKREKEGWREREEGRKEERVGGRGSGR